MFKARKELYYQCPNCNEFVRECKVGAFVAPQCPKCKMTLGQENRVFPRRIRVKCSAPLCGHVFKAAVSIKGGIKVLCPKCEQEILGKDIFPRLPVRVVKRGGKALLMGAIAALSCLRAGAVGTAKGVAFAAKSPFVAIKRTGQAGAWLALSPFRAVACAATAAYDLPFNALERFIQIKTAPLIKEQELRLNAERERQEYERRAKMMEAESQMQRRIDLDKEALKRSITESLAVTCGDFIPPSIPPRMPMGYDGLCPGELTKITALGAEIVTEVIKQDLYYDEVELFDGLSYLRWFETLAGKTDAQAKFHADGGRLTSQDRIVLMKRMWVEITECKGISAEEGKRILTGTSVDVDVDYSRIIRCTLFDLCRGSVSCAGMVILGGRNLEVVMRSMGGVRLPDGKRMKVRIVFDGVELKPRCKVAC